jgi:hypothetical protein
MFFSRYLTAASTISKTCWMSKTLFRRINSTLTRIPIATFKQKFNNFGEEIDDETDLNLDARTTVNKFLESYARRDLNTKNILIESFFQL